MLDQTNHAAAEPPAADFEDGNRELDRQILVSGLATRAGLGLLRNPQCCPLLGEEERRRRREIQRSLWAGGARRIVDEGLLADAIRRLPDLAARIADSAWRRIE